MSRVFLDKETGKITKLRLENVITSYSYLISPRPEGQFKSGTYSSEFIIRDEETIKLVKQYVKEIAESAVHTTWNGKLPQNLTLPYRLGDDEKESEAGAFIVKTGGTKFQPTLLIRNPQTGRAKELEEEEHEEFYSGMEADADIVFRAYNVNGACGITAYVNAVCKVGEGTPFGNYESTADSFSLEGDFDSFNTEETPKASTKKTKKVEVEETGEVSLDDLVATPSTKKPGTNPPAPKAPTKQLTIDDLL